MLVLFGLGNILIDLGRIDRVMQVIKYGRFQSPFLGRGKTHVLNCSLIYLYLRSFPISRFRDRMQGGFRKGLYEVLARLGRTEKQIHYLEKGYRHHGHTVCR